MSQAKKLQIQSDANLHEATGCIISADRGRPASNGEKERWDASGIYSP